MKKSLLSVFALALIAVMPALAGAGPSGKLLIFHAGSLTVPFAAIEKYPEVEVSGKKPGAVITKTGKSCTYGITMVKDGPNPEAAEAFLAFLLSSDKGLATLKQMGQPPFVPARVPDQAMADKLPKSLAGLVEVRN